MYGCYPYLSGGLRSTSSTYLTRFRAPRHRSIPKIILTDIYFSTASPEIFLLLLWVASQNGVLPNNSTRQHGVIDIAELKNKHPQRSIALLDALTAICIDEPRKQVVAVRFADDGRKCFSALQQTTVLHLQFHLDHLSNIFSQLKDICFSLQSPLQERNNETNTPQALLLHRV